MVSYSVTSKESTTTLSLAALGVVYGDIGTSPLYAMRESLSGLPINNQNVFGILSLIFWSLLFVISIKYLWVIFKADNDGEGGILSLLALASRPSKKRLTWLFVLGIFGGGLMLGDGMLTPAISVLSAMEGLTVISPEFAEFILPTACTILLLLFYIQQFGTASIGKAFGPIILLWFCTIAILGLAKIWQSPAVLAAINPTYAIIFFIDNGWKGYLLLGGVFLVVTGGEALYADLGHFGKKPIRFSWIFVALPSLLLNYFGQGASLINNPQTISNPFYLMAPTWFYIPLLIIATLATIIASQAVISATFSLTKQAILLGLYPPLNIVQTSSSEQGQIYVPHMNFILAIGTLIFIIMFKNSSALAHAYGVAVNLVMVLTIIMTAYIAHVKWKWSISKIALIFGWFVLIDLLFLGANLNKLHTGGWIPIMFASIIAVIMFTWNQGISYLRNTYYEKKEDLYKVLNLLDHQHVHKLDHTPAIFITDTYDHNGSSFLHFLQLCNAMPENILIVSYKIENIPRVSIENRFEVKHITKNIYQLILHYGFMNDISIPQSLSLANERKVLPFTINTRTTTYFVGVPNIIASNKKATLQFYWQEQIFSFLLRNYSANLNIEFYNLPQGRTVAIGIYCVI
jgi:KUP system potassium uptake protein